MSSCHQLLDGTNLLLELFVDTEALADVGDAVDDGGVVAVETAGDGRERHVGVFFGQIGYNLTGVADFALAALGEEDGVLDVE